MRSTSWHESAGAGTIAASVVIAAAIKIIAISLQWAVCGRGGGDVGVWGGGGGCECGNAKPGAVLHLDLPTA